MRGPASVLTALILGLPLAAGLRADTITLTGTTIAISDCSVQALRGGEIFYRDARGKLYRRPLEDVSSLGFTGLPALDEAESAIAAGRLDEGLQRLLQAMLETENDLQRLWLHARLCRLHDERGEFVSAAGHAAIVWSLSNDVSWRILEPMTPLDEASPCTYAAAVEALAALQHAQAKIKQPVLLRLTERLIARVQPLCEALGREYSGPPIDPEGTISGVSKRRIRQGDRAASDTARRAPTTVPPALEEVAGSESLRSFSADSIEGLLQARRFADAVAACQRVAEQPGSRNLPQFLDQYGRALRGAGRDLDAAVMFMRSAILFPASPQAPSGLIETALIYREVLVDRDTARRLLERAIDLATELDRPALRQRAQLELKQLDGMSP